MARRRDFARGTAAIMPKRLTSWFQYQPVEATMTAAGGTIMFTLNAAALALRPFTIIRSRFEIWLRSDQNAAAEVQAAAVGMAIVSDQATAIGVTAIPTPITDMSSDLWFFYQLLHGDEASVANLVKPETRVSVDSKAMRKVDIGQDVVVVGEMDAAISNGVILGVGGRQLIKVN